jgi:hypothetical protein
VLNLVINCSRLLAAVDHIEPMPARPKLKKYKNKKMLAALRGLSPPRQSSNTDLSAVLCPPSFKSGSNWQLGRGKGIAL